MRVACAKCGTVSDYVLSAGACDKCGQSLRLPSTADAGRREHAIPPSQRPISTTCPAGGGAQYKSCAGTRWIAIGSDRQCAVCGTQYTPPTPRWAAVGFVLLGGAITAGCVFGIVEYGISGTVTALVPMALIGGAAIVHGVRALVRQGRV